MRLCLWAWIAVLAMLATLFIQPAAAQLVPAGILSLDVAPRAGPAIELVRGESPDPIAFFYDTSGNLPAVIYGYTADDAHPPYSVRIGLALAPTLTKGGGGFVTSARPVAVPLLT